MTEITAIRFTKSQMCEKKLKEVLDEFNCRYVVEVTTRIYSPGQKKIVRYEVVVVDKFTGEP